MDLSTNMLIEIGLDVIGYIAAGGFWMLVYSAIQKKRQPAPSEAGPSMHPPVTPSLAPATTGGARSHLEFIPLKTMPNEDQTDRRTDRGRGHERAVIIKMARSMLQAGSSAAQVRSVLPISDAELALLHYDR